MYRYTHETLMRQNLQRETQKKTFLWTETERA